MIEITQIIAFLKDIGINFVKDYGYIGLFLISFIGTSIIPIPIEVIALISVGILENPILVGLVSGLGSGLGSCINYFIGLKIGKKIYERFGKEKIKSAKEFFDKYGFFSLVIAAFTPIPWDIFSVLSGFLHYDFKKYMLASLIGRIPRFLIIAIIGEEALKWLILLM